MRSAQPSPLDPKIVRYIRWTTLWLRWMQGFLAFVCGDGSKLSRQAEAIAHAWLDQVARMLALCIVTFACGRAKPRGPKSWRREPVFPPMRAVIGSRLRRALCRHGDVQTRTDALERVMRNLEGWIYHLARHVGGLARRRGRDRVCSDLFTRAPTLGAPAPADTS